MKTLLSFGADLNVLNDRGQSALDIATACFINQEQKLHSRQIWHAKQRNNASSVATVKVEKKKPSSGGSPLLKNLVPSRPKLIDYTLTDDLEGWVNVDFTPYSLMHQPKEIKREFRIRDLTDPVQIPLEDIHRSGSLDAGRGGTSEDGDELLHESYHVILDLLHAAGGMGSTQLQHMPSSPAHPISFSGNHGPDLAMELERSIRLQEYEDGATILSLYEALEDTINRRMEELTSLRSADEAIALAYQQKEMKAYKKTRPNIVGGKRRVCALYI